MKNAGKGAEHIGYKVARRALLMHSSIIYLVFPITSIAMDITAIGLAYPL